MSDRMFVMPEGTTQSGVDPNLLLTQMNNGGFGGNGNWIWMFFLLLLYGRNGFGNGVNDNVLGTGYLSNQINNGAGRDLLMQAINGNGNAVQNLATNLNCDLNSVKTALNSLQYAVGQVGNQVGMSSAQVINAIQQGNMQLQSLMSQCCCDNKMMVQLMGYEGLLRDLTNTCNITTRISDLANGVQTGFANIGYLNSLNTNAIIQAGNTNTLRIVDILNNHWQSDLQLKYADAKLELSQLNQNATLIAALKTTTNA